MEKKAARIVFFVLAAIFALSPCWGNEATDLFSGSTELHIRAGGGIVNPLLGFEGEVELRRLAGKIDLLAGGAWGTAAMLDESVLPLLGSSGGLARLSLGYQIGEASYSVKSFHAIQEVSRTSRTVTYLGFYFDQPVHDSHWIDLEVRLEPTGVLSEVGYDEESLKMVYGLKPGYSIFVYPNYRYTFESDYIIHTVMNHPKATLVSLSVGPAFSPDFTKLGGILDGYLGINTVGFNIYVAVGIGYIARLGIPAGTLLSSTNRVTNYKAVGGFGDVALFGYMPMRVTVGVSYKFDFGKGEKK